MAEAVVAGTSSHQVAVGDPLAGLSIAIAPGRQGAMVAGARPAEPATRPRIGPGATRCGPAS